MVHSSTRVQPKINDIQKNQNSILPPSLVGGPTDPTVLPYAHKMWKWCKDHEVNIRDLAIQFALNAPVEGNGIVLTGPGNPKEFKDVYKSATTNVPLSVWNDFESEFCIRFSYFFIVYNVMLHSIFVCLFCACFLYISV